MAYFTPRFRVPPIIFLLLINK